IRRSSIRRLPESDSRRHRGPPDLPLSILGRKPIEMYRSNFSSLVACPYFEHRPRKRRVLRRIRAKDRDDSASPLLHRSNWTEVVSGSPYRRTPRAPPTHTWETLRHGGSTALRN